MKHLDYNQLSITKHCLLGLPAGLGVPFSLIIVFKVKLKELRGKKIITGVTSLSNHQAR